MVGYDIWFMEVARILMLHGVDVIAHPCSFTLPVEPQFLAPERGLENKAFLVSASRSGTPCIGQSRLIDPYGRHLDINAGRHPRHIYSFVTVSLAREKLLAARSDLVLQRWRLGWLDWPDMYTLVQAKR